MERIPVLLLLFFFFFLFPFLLLFLVDGSLVGGHGHGHGHGHGFGFFFFFFFFFFERESEEDGDGRLGGRRLGDPSSASSSYYYSSSYSSSSYSSYSSSSSSYSASYSSYSSSRPPSRSRCHGPPLPEAPRPRQHDLRADPSVLRGLVGAQCERRHRLQESRVAYLVESRGRDGVRDLMGENEYRAQELGANPDVGERPVR